MAIDVDNSTLPVDNALSSPASEGAGEFRALKAKVNALFLNTGIAATLPRLIDTNNMGVNSVITDGSDADLYGSKYTVTRNVSKVRDTFGLYGFSVLANNINVGTKQISGMGAIVQTGTGCTFGFVFGLSTAIYQQTHTHAATISGVFIVFADRLTVGVAAPGGIGGNQYNKGATAVLIDAFPRSSTGEFCGWKNGIVFTSTSMDQDINGSGYCIDFSALTYRGGTDPANAFWASSVLRMAAYQSIIWEAGNNVRTYYDASTGRWTLSSAGVKKFEVDITTGTLYSAGVAVTVP